MGMGISVGALPFPQYHAHDKTVCLAAVTLSGVGFEESLVEGDYGNLEQSGLINFDRQDSARGVCEKAEAGGRF